MSERSVYISLFFITIQYFLLSVLYVYMNIVSSFFFDPLKEKIMFAFVMEFTMLGLD